MAAAAKTYNGLPGYLATIESSGEFDYVKGLSGNTEIWINGYYNASYGGYMYDTGPYSLGNVFVWYKGSNCYSYCPWGSGEPSSNSAVILKDTTEIASKVASTAGLSWAVEYSNLTCDKNICHGHGQCSQDQTSCTCRFDGVNGYWDSNTKCKTCVAGRNGANCLDIQPLIYDNSTGSWFEFVQSSVSWQSALEAARLKTLNGTKGYLASFISEKSYEVLRGPRWPNFWVAMSDYYCEGIYLIMDGPHSNTTVYNATRKANLCYEYCPWSEGEPSATVYENFLELDSRQGLNDLDETALRSYVIQYQGVRPENYVTTESACPVMPLTNDTWVTNVQVQSHTYANFYLYPDVTPEQLFSAVLFWWTNLENTNITVQVDCDDCNDIANQLTGYINRKTNATRQDNVGYNETIYEDESYADYFLEDVPVERYYVSVFNHDSIYHQFDVKYSSVLFEGETSSDLYFPIIWILVVCLLVIILICILIIIIIILVIVIIIFLPVFICILIFIILYYIILA